MSTTEKDDMVGAAYERLESALAPPLDGAERVAQRIAVRRRRRRVARVGVVVVVVAGVAGGVAIARSGDGPAGTVAVDQPPGPHSTLILTRPDGSTYAFPNVTVSCEPPVPDGAQGPADGRIWMYSPIVTDGDLATDDDAKVLEPFVYFEGVVAKLQGDETFTLPVDGPDDSASYPLTLFMADNMGDARSNEVSSAVSGSAGTVRVLRASCDPSPVLELEVVDATLGSEVGQQSLDIAGALR
jgi:hypothetical protein